MQEVAAFLHLHVFLLFGVPSASEDRSRPLRAGEKPARPPAQAETAGSDARGSGRRRFP